MKTEIFAELKGSGKDQPVFDGLEVHAELRETMAITTVTQSYRNSGSENMEAVYTFPLPLDAVLLEMTVTLGDKTLKGTVLPRQKAEERYEEAITDGDAPVMLQNPQPGIYTMNVGNLLPSEKAKVMIRYAMFQRWQGDTLRYHLPTTIAPRYGSAEQAGLAPHQEPETSLLADNFFSFEMRVIGEMAGRGIESPSHEISIERGSKGKESVVNLVRKTAFMDRDLVITVKKGNQQAASTVVERDGDEYLLWGSFQTQFDLAEDQTPRSVKIVVDCSGSMGGDSIAQARVALLRVLDELRPQDWFNIVVFGSSATPLFNAQTKADRESLSYARGFLKKMDADMGGTEIGGALDMAVRFRCPEKVPQDVLLITDGEIWDWEKVVDKALKSNHRFFTVGVGSSVSEAFVHSLAKRSGGACELVSPTENMAERIHRHFKRIGTSRSSSSEVIWPTKPLRVYPEEMACIYDGDTNNIFAWFAQPPEGEMQLQVSLPDGSKRIMPAGIELLATPGDRDADIPRMAAALRLREIDKEEAGQELAVKYQLVSRWTNYLAIVVRDDGEKVDTLPELHKVQQMMAAGWGGFGTIDPMHGAGGGYDRPLFSRSSSCARIEKSYISSMTLSECTADYQSSPTLPSLAWVWEEIHPGTLNRFLALLDQILTSGNMPTTIHLPLLPAVITMVLARLIGEGIDEQAVVTHFLHHLAGSEAGSQLSRQAKRAIAKAYKELQVDRKDARTIKDILRVQHSGIDSDDEYDIPTFLRRRA